MDEYVQVVTEFNDSELIENSTFLSFIIFMKNKLSTVIQ